MIEIIKLLIGTFVLLLAAPIGSFLALETKEELKQGKKWFMLIFITSMFLGFLSLFTKNDFLFFSFFFIAIVTSKSLKNKK